ncbi:porin [Paraburkholderia caballeronis]|uniref:Outer membrane protein (Porin) n=1 Tax=Paraburkholderia caballeronis TaxID=416943 RepID=A0A1H7LCB4_9BURK|nr:porin [Paraburkholderia caballeronis]PXW28400.1 putative porin [Paraburkholderia caballeronis]PXX03766.1 putative porin [Paraburkholderia caballeronis]RAK04510.1 putative porin [Paraburkholderia caballeronis]SED77232.1 Outer membrane protein (porin) [Paraburkholderia caballeronis]SEK96584.1 Outer membrane protein (porin) [Paraburkholderia caballeronis]
MKKTIKAAAAAAGLLALAPSLCHADSVFSSLMPAFGPGYGSVSGNLVSIYGTVDEYIDHYNAGGQTATRLLSGGAWTSKIGIYGREELTPRLSVHFRLENGFNANDGTFGAPNTMFNRAAYVGIASKDWGGIDLGKQFGVGLQLFVDPFFGVSKLSPWTYFGSVSDLGRGASTVEARVSNAAVYTSPSLAGFTAQLLYAFKGDQSEGPAAQNRGGALTYANGPLYVSASFNQTWCDPSAGACTDTTTRTDSFGAAMIYDMGRYAVSASWQLFDPRYAQDFVAREYSLGSLARFGAHMFRGSLVYRDVTQTANHAVGLQIGDDYFLSKRTALYARVSVIKNAANSQMTNDLYGSGPLPAKGASVTDFALGVYHNF